MKLLRTALAAGVVMTGSAKANELDSAFHIMRKGVPIGYHVVDVEETADGVRVETRIEMRVKFGPIPVFRYRHFATELWRDGVLVSLESSTNDNGDEMSMSATREGGVLMIDGTAYEGAAPANTMPSSYWLKTTVETDTLLNTQNGELIEVDVSSLGETAAPHGQVAEQYLLTGTVALNLWYEDARWVGSNFVIDGEELTYQLVEEGEEQQRLFAMVH